MPKALQWPLTLAFIVFGLSFVIFGAFLPGGFIGGVLKVILFPVLFIGSIAGVLYVYRKRLFSFLLDGQERFLAGAKALTAIAERADLTYVPAPGGAPGGLKIFANQGWAPKELKDAVALLDSHGGMDEALQAAKQTGLLMANTIILASEETKAKFIDQQLGNVRLEDGFHGTREGVAFDAFEWVETVEDDPNIHHLMIVLAAPTRLNGVTQMRSKGAAWPYTEKADELQTVSLGPKTFDERFRLRANDQVEARAIFNPAVMERVIALAHGEKIRAVATGQHLVLDIAGANRFALVDLGTGAWSDETIRQTFADVADLTALVDEAAHAFMVRS